MTVPLTYCDPTCRRTDNDNQGAANQTMPRWIIMNTTNTIAALDGRAFPVKGMGS